MTQYIIKRLLYTIPTLFAAAALVFFLLRMLPGDPCFLRLEGGSITPEQLNICREEFGFNDPAIIQFGRFLWGLITFDFGKSMWTGQDVLHEISIRFQLSLQVAIIATATAVIISIPLGVIAAVKQDTLIDYAVRVLSIGGIAIPSFWLGILIILALLYASEAITGVPWMPPIRYTPIWEDPLENLAQLFWPAVATGYRYSAVATRMTRSVMLEVLREDYIRTARAKGLLEKAILVRHALRNALLPVITILSIEFANLIAGLVVTEQVFNLNGIGKLFVNSVSNKDFPMTQTLVMMIVTVFVFVNLIVDIVYAWLDPRIRFS